MSHFGNASSYFGGGPTKKNEEIQTVVEASWVFHHSVAVREGTLHKQKFSHVLCTLQQLGFKLKIGKVVTRQLYTLCVLWWVAAAIPNNTLVRIDKWRIKGKTMSGEMGAVTSIQDIRCHWMVWKWCECVCGNVLDGTLHDHHFNTNDYFHYQLICR